MFLLLAHFHARPLSYKALILALQLDIFNDERVIPVREEKFRLPVDVHGSKTSMLKLSINQYGSVTSFDFLSGEGSVEEAFRRN